MKATLPAPAPFLNPKYDKLIRIFVAIAKSNRPISTADIAKEIRFGKSSVEMYLSIAMKTGYIKGIKGPNGGFELTVPANEITMLDIIGKLVTLKGLDAGIKTISEKMIAALDEINLQDVLEWDK